MSAQALLPGVVQRWRARRDHYRPAGEPIETHRYEVAEIPDDRTAKAFVLASHYSGTYPAARYRVGLYRGAALVGVAVFSHPASDRVLTNVFPCEPREAVELGRFVLADDVPANGESWMLARAFELVRRHGVRGVVAFSDPVPRHLADGTVVLPGHVGVIYQAHNGAYLGRSRARTLRVLPDGSVLSDRAASKVRTGERGWQHVVAQLVRAGAAPLAPGADPAGWLGTWAARVTRAVRHAGCHRYAWPLDRALRRHLDSSTAYPKRLDPAPA